MDSSSARTRRASPIHDVAPIATTRPTTLVPNSASVVMMRKIAGMAIMESVNRMTSGIQPSAAQPGQRA